MTQTVVQLQYDADSEDNEVIAAHAYRDREILCTVLIRPTLDGQFHIQVSGQKFLYDTVVSDRTDAINRADAYLAGYMAGRDEERDEYGKANPRCDWPDADKRAGFRCLRCGGGIATGKSIRRD